MLVESLTKISREPIKHQALIYMISCGSLHSCIWPITMKGDRPCYPLKVPLSPDFKTCSFLVTEVFDWKPGFGCQWRLRYYSVLTIIIENVAFKNWSLGCKRQRSPQNPRKAFSCLCFKSSHNFITNLLNLHYKVKHEKKNNHMWNVLSIVLNMPVKISYIDPNFWGVIPQNIPKSCCTVFVICLKHDLFVSAVPRCWNSAAFDYFT